jgi:hypothetical protein
MHVKLVELRVHIQARRGSALDLLIESVVGRGPEPARHDYGVVVVVVVIGK